MDSAARDGLEQVKRIHDVSRETCERLTIYHDLLKQWQKRINLIANSTIDDIWHRHIVDSIQTVRQCEGKRRIIDIGSGGGLPGMVVALCAPDWGGAQMNMIESVGKKCAFLRAVVRETGLVASGADVTVHNTRIEATLAGLAEPEIITARALASLADLLAMTEVHLSKGSVGLFAKGRDHEGELAAAHKIFDFDCEILPSPTSAGSVLLKVGNVCRK